MSDFTKYIQNIARTDEIMAKIRSTPITPDKTGLPAGVSYGIGIPTKVCPSSYNLPANSSFDIGDLIDGLKGPTLADSCTRLNTITGLTDFDTVAMGQPNAGAIVNLILQMDGIFK